MSARCTIATLLLVAVALVATDARGQVANPSPARIPGVGIDQKLNEQVPLDITFRDEAGKVVALGDYFGKRPVILTLVYYNCPMLCTLELNGLLAAVKQLDLSIGKDFDVLTISFDARETPLMAAAKKANYLRAYGRPGAEEGWHFLTGEPGSISRLTGAAGFHFKFDLKSGEFAHPTAIIVLTSGGRISSYFFGLNYAPRDLKFGLFDAADGKINLPADESLLKLCYHYDPVTGKYALAVMRIVKAAGVLTILLVGGLILFLFRRERRKAAALAGAGEGGAKHP